MGILDFLFRKNTPLGSPPVEDPPDTEDSPKEETKYFGGVVAVCTEGGVLSGSITCAGKEKLNAFTRDELMLYFATLLENHTIHVDVNIYGRGPLTKAREFLAFRVIVSEFFARLDSCKRCAHTKSAQEEVSDGS